MHISITGHNSECFLSTSATYSQLAVGNDNIGSRNAS